MMISLTLAAAADLAEDTDGHVRGGHSHYGALPTRVRHVRARVFGRAPVRVRRALLPGLLQRQNRRLFRGRSPAGATPGPIQAFLQHTSGLMGGLSTFYSMTHYEREPS
jgi:hypothetical protein